MEHPTLIWLVLAVLVSLISLTTAVDLKCPYKECKCKDTVIDCSGRDLQEIPTLATDYGTGFTKLIMKDNNISEILDNQFPANLDEIDLRGNPLKNISILAFDNNRYLHALRLGGASFKDLPSALVSLNALEEFEVKNTVVRTYPTDVIDKISNSVVKLTLDGVDLKPFPAWLKKFHHLRQLNLANNLKLGQVEKDELATFGNSLTHLSLENTGQKESKFLNPLKKLEHLVLKNNKIGGDISLSYYLITSRDSLKSIDLSFNNLQNMPRLGELKNLEEVYLRYNALSGSTVQALSESVRVLDLTNNAFVSVPAFVREATNLEVLSLTRNKIAKIVEGDIPTLLSLRSLKLGENLITTVDHIAFQGVPNVEYLDIGFNKLTRLPLALESLSGLKELSIPGMITTLKCTCGEKALGQWFESKDDLHVVGNCKGSPDVKMFFTQSAALCAD